MLNDPRRPLYLQVHDQIRTRILAGEWRAGQALPSETAFIKQTGVSQGTVRKALNALADADLIERRQGLGTFIPLGTIEDNLSRFFRIIDSEGKTVEPEIQSQTLREVDLPQVAADAMQMINGKKMQRLDRLLSLHNTPAMLQRIYINMAGEALLDENDPDIYSKYHKTVGRNVQRTKDVSRAISASKSIAWALRCSFGAPVLQINRTAFDISGHPFEFSQSYVASQAWGYSVELT